MTRPRATRIAVLLLLAALLGWGVVEANRAILDRFGPARGTLVAAALTGSVFFVASVTGLRWVERRQARMRSHRDDPHEGT